MYSELSHYQSRAVRALVLIHDRHLRSFVGVWKRAKAAQVTLPVTDDENYRSLEHLLRHVMRSGRNYMIDIYSHLGRPEPVIELAPVPDEVEAQSGAYLEYLLGRWRELLADVQDGDLEPETYTPGIHYWIDAMLEHAAMHPVRHEFQLRELLDRPG